MRNKRLALVLLVVGTILCRADTVPPVNFQAIELLIKQRVENPAPPEARFIAADFDINFLPAHYHANAYRMPCMATQKSTWGGVDSLILHHSRPIEMTTIRSKIYWVMHARKAAFPRNDPVLWIAERLGLNNTVRFAEPSWKGYRVARFNVPEFKPVTNDDMPRYEKNRWMRTLRVMENEMNGEVIVYAQIGLIGAPEWQIKQAQLSRWFDEMKSSRRPTNRSFQKWWRFGEWSIWSKGKKDDSNINE